MCTRQSIREKKRQKLNLSNNDCNFPSPANAAVEICALPLEFKDLKYCDGHGGLNIELSLNLSHIQLNQIVQAGKCVRVNRCKLAVVTKIPVISTLMKFGTKYAI